jgi:hypothetical protein
MPQASEHRRKYSPQKQPHGLLFSWPHATSSAARARICPKIKLLNKELDALFLQRLQDHFIAGSLQIMR